MNEVTAMLGGLLLGAGVFARWYASVSALADLAGATTACSCSPARPAHGEVQRRRKPPGTI